mmetsp:Transcript_597/g.608  ORF Transcript_597/g.608 Transcript_597/m.608 type:complete len:108 (-) Transcript_597:340-663(-)
MTYEGLMESIPLIIFAFLYQPNIPRIYRELTVKRYKTMNGVSILSSIIIVVLYSLASTFGYLAVIGNDEYTKSLKDKRNILEVPIENLAFRIGLIGLILSMVAIAPT